MRRFWFYVLLLCAIFFTFFFTNFYYKNKETKREELILKIRKSNFERLRQSIANEINKFNGEVSILIKDLDTNWQISFNEEKPFISASLVKIPIMAICFFLASKDKLNLDKTIKIKPQDKIGGSGILKYIKDNTEFSMKKLIGLMIYESDNTATNIITNLIGIDNLNYYFKYFGLKNTNFSRKIADYRSRRRGKENYTTAKDLAFLLERFYRGEFVNKDVSEKCIKILKLQRINDRIPRYLPSSVSVAHKTGLERNICHDVGIVFTKKGDFIICVLTKNGNLNSSKEFIAKISLLTYNYFKNL